jgi:hypothetical protein
MIRKIYFFLFLIVLTFSSLAVAADVKLSLNTFDATGNPKTEFVVGDKIIIKVYIESETKNYPFKISGPTVNVNGNLNGILDYANGGYIKGGVYADSPLASGTKGASYEFVHFPQSKEISSKGLLGTISLNAIGSADSFSLSFGSSTSMRHGSDDDGAPMIYTFSSSPVTVKVKAKETAPSSGCTADADCAGKYCFSGTCVDCLTAANCGTGKECVANKCQDKKCTTNADCPAATPNCQVDGTCSATVPVTSPPTSECASNGDCITKYSANHICTSGKCVLNPADIITITEVDRAQSKLTAHQKITTPFYVFTTVKDSNGVILTFNQEKVTSMEQSAEYISKVGYNDPNKVTQKLVVVYDLPAPKTWKVYLKSAFKQSYTPTGQ